MLNNYAEKNKITNFKEHVFMSYFIFIFIILFHVLGKKQKNVYIYIYIYINHYKTNLSRSSHGPNILCDSFGNFIIAW